VIANDDGLLLVSASQQYVSALLWLARRERMLHTPWATRRGPRHARRSMHDTTALPRALLVNDCTSAAAMNALAIQEQGGVEVHDVV